MNYPGNASLAEEIQRKILDTFGQSLDLAGAGKREEALLGCDFVLRLDPLFEPARALQSRVEAQEGAVPVDDLAADLAALLTAPAAAQADEPPAGEPASSTGPGAASAEGTETALPEVAGPAPGGLLDSAEITLEAPGIDMADEPTAAPASEEDEAALLESALSLDALTADPGGDAGASEDAPPDDTAAPSEPAAALDQESEDRVAELLAEGQASFDEGSYQSAIDAWSRIFLIDIEHPEANRRIELARKLRAEVERKLEEKYHEALAKLESGELDEAKSTFAELLEMQPGHIQAREYLDRLSAGEFERRDDDEPESPAEPAPDVAPAPEPPELESAFDSGELDFPAEMYEPPAQPIEADRPQVRASSSRRTLFVIAGLVLAVVLVAAWLLWRNWDRAFPSAEEEPAAQPVARVDPIDRATALYIEGQAAMAIAQLRRLPPAHPQYAEAQALIAQWEAASEQAAADELSEELKAERDRLVALAREAFANREFLAAEELFDLARQQAPLDDGASALAAETADRLEPLRSEIEIFSQGEWAYALRNLWPKHEEDPGNPDIVRLMVDGYYNLAVRELQRGDLDAALENLAEASLLDGGDTEIQRLLSFAETYRQRDQDLLYRIFVKYLPFR